tara:strand:- start:284 stop:1051 length:768 start_codon:yes stop_codon:yes gene_type:complete
MIFLEHLYNLSIVFVIFNLVWGIIVTLPKAFITGFNPNNPLNHFLSALKFLLLSNLTFSKCLQCIRENSTSIFELTFIYIIGGTVLSLYIIGKLNKKKSILSFVSNMALKGKFNINSDNSKTLKYENHIAGITIVFFTACIAFPILGEIINKNPLNIWFYNTIEGLYQAPILKGIFGISGVFFMVSIFQKGIATIKDLVIKLSGQKPKEMKKNPLEEVFKNVNGNPFSESKESEKIDLEDDLYVDFEEMDEKENK